MCSFLETHGCLQMYFRRAEFCWLDFAVFAWACILIHHQSLLYVYFKRKGYNSALLINVSNVNPFCHTFIDFTSEDIFSFGKVIPQLTA